MRRLSLVLVLLAAPVALASTSCLNDACVKTAAARGAAAALVDDAQLSLAQAQNVISTINNPEVRAKALAALAGAEAALQSATRVLHGLEGACTSPDVAAVFRDFVAAWKLLAPFLTMFGGPNAGGQVAAPMVVGMAH